MNTELGSLRPEGEFVLADSFNFDDGLCLESWKGHGTWAEFVYDFLTGLNIQDVPEHMTDQDVCRMEWMPSYGMCLNISDTADLQCVVHHDKTLYKGEWLPYDSFSTNRHSDENLEGYTYHFDNKIYAFVFELEDLSTDEEIKKAVKSVFVFSRFEDASRFYSPDKKDFSQFETDIFLRALMGDSNMGNVL